MKFSYFILLLAQLTFLYGQQSQKKAALTTINDPSPKCLDARECAEIDMKTCECGPNQLCAQTERSCLTCPQLICIDAKPENNEGSTIPIIAGSVISVVIFLLGVGLYVYYYRNRAEFSARGGFLGYVKYHAHRSSLNNQLGSGSNSALLSSPNSVSESKRSSTVSMFDTAHPHNMNTNKIQPKVLVMNEKDRATQFSSDSEKQRCSQTQVGTRGNTLFQTDPIRDSYYNTPLPTNPPPIDEEDDDPPRIMENGLLSSMRLSEMFAPSAPLPHRSSPTSPFQPEFTDHRPDSVGSFATQILTNPLVESDYYGSDSDPNATPLPPPPTARPDDRRASLSDIIVTQHP